MSPNRAPRLADFNYVGAHRYFLTICVYPRRPAFSSPAAGQFVVEQLLRSAGRFQFEIPAYCVMPDHVHVLAETTHHDGDLLRFVSHWKQLTGYQWKKRTGEKLWQKGFFDRVLRPEDEDVAVVNYIVSNPVRDGLVQTPQDYPLTGSSRYTFEQLSEVLTDWSPSG